MSKRAILTEEQAVFSRQKRYMSEKAIISAIDEARAKQRAMMEMAERIKGAIHLGDLMLRQEDFNQIGALNVSHGFGMTDYKQISDYLFAKAERMEDRILNLGHKLAAFRTGLLSFTNDPAVV
jgi:hypothetical protein